MFRNRKVVFTATHETPSILPETLYQLRFAGIKTVGSCSVNSRIKIAEDDMPDIERTSAGFQAVIPGCERRTLPKSTTSSDDTGQGLLDFYCPPTLREKIAALADAPLQPRRLQPR